MPEAFGHGKDYVRTDERDDVVASLELCALLLPLIDKKPQFWKWVLIGAHNAVQGAAVCALSGTSGIGALDKKSARAKTDWYESPDPKGRMPEGRLADFNELLKRACRAEPMQYLEGRPLRLTEQQKRDLRKLHKEFRNNLLHFTAKGWSIETVGLPRIARAAVDATEQLMAHPAAAFHLSSAQRARLRSAIRSIRERVT